MKPQILVHMRRTLALGLFALLNACGARSSDGLTEDSQGHWLEACQTSNECGSAECLCAVCTTECVSDEDCWQTGGDRTSRCASVELQGCAELPERASVCVPDCPGDGCISAERSTTEEITTLAVSESRLEFDDYRVPECPEPARRVSLPLASAYSAVDYEGIVTVDSFETNVTGEVATLILNGSVGDTARITFRQVPNINLGQRFSALIRGGEQSGEHLIILRDDAGVLVAAVSSGTDALYQAGLFRTKDTWGATVELRMLCQSSVGDVCYEDQVQAEYMVSFTGDDSVETEGVEYRTLHIEGRPYQLSGQSQSVDGGKPLCDLTAGRSLDFAALLTEEPGNPDF